MRHAILAATLLALLLLAAGAWVAVAEFRSLRVGDALADRVRAAEATADLLLSTLKDAETGQRGFLVTGEPSYLAPYEDARARLDADFGRLALSPLVDPARVERLRALAAAKMGELAETVALRRAGRGEAAVEAVRTGQGKRTMDAIRAEVDALAADAEAVLQAARTRAASPWRWATPIGLGVLASALLGGVALAQRRVRRDVAAAFARLERFTRGFGLTQGMLREADGRIVFWNGGAERLYGYRSEEALGRISHELLRTRFPQPLPEIEAALRRDGEWRGELVHHRADGEALTVMGHWVLHRGEPEVVIVASTDITAQRRAEGDLRRREALLRLALDASALGTWRWEVGERTETLEWDARCKALFGFPPDAAVDYTAWAAAIPAEDRAVAEAGVARALDPADPHDDFACEYRAVHPDGRVLRLAATGRAMFERDPAAPAGRRALRILGTILDATEQRAAEATLRRTDMLLRAIVDAAPNLIYAKDVAGRMLLANGPVLDLIGRPWAEVEGRTDAEFLDDLAQAEAVMANDRRVLAAGLMEELEEPVGEREGRPRVWLSTKAPMRDPEGRVVGLVGVSVEITRRKRAEEKLRLLVDELNHRVKNTLATVQSTASLTLREADPVLRRNFEARLFALAAAHDILTREHWEGANLHDVVAGVLAPHDGPAGGRGGGRFDVAGPAVRLRPRAALALAMGLHELATNAMKHGALSRDGGRVGVRWDVAEGNAPRLRLAWTESGGPPVAPMTRPGFGTRLIERSLAHDLGGPVTLDFAPAGLRCVIEAPLDRILARAGEEEARAGAA